MPTNYIPRKHIKSLCFRIREVFGICSQEGSEGTGQSHCAWTFGMCACSGWFSEGPTTVSISSSCLCAILSNGM